MSHMMTQHGRVEETQWLWSTLSAGAGPRTFRMTFLAKGGPWNCPVEGCPVRVATRTAMWVHFLHEHVLDTIVILEEGNFPHLRCARCDMLVPRRALNGRNTARAQCARGAERKRRRLAEAETRESSERAFEAYGEPIQNVSAFRYMGRVLTAVDNDWLAVVGNLGKLRKSLGGYFGFWDKRGQIRRCQETSIRLRRRQCYSLGQRCGSSPKGWRTPCTVFNPGSQGGSQGSSRGGGQTGAETTRLWRRHWGRQG